MDDLAGLDWSSSSMNKSKPPPLNPGGLYPSLRPTPPPSGRATPSIVQGNGLLSSASTGTRPPSKSSTPANDSFSTLVTFSSTKSANNLSLQEQQKRLQKERLEKEAEQRKHLDAQFGAQDSQFWNTLSGRTTSNQVSSPSNHAGIDDYGRPRSSNTINKPFAALDSRTSQTRKPAEIDESDILSAFNSEAPVDSSSYYPPPANLGSQRSTPGLGELGPAKSSSTTGLENLSGNDLNGGLGNNDDDDLFGLGQMGSKQAPPATYHGSSGGHGGGGADDDDVLGLLGRPVSDLPSTRTQESSRTDEIGLNTKRGNPEDKALAELIDMGFPPNKARQALAETDDGFNVQAAVGWLLNQAHTKSRHQAGRRDTIEEALARTNSGRRQTQNGTDRRHKDEGDREAEMPAWMVRENRSKSAQNRQDSRSPANGTHDVGQYASEIGSTLFKSANTLWKTGTKKVQKAVAELQYEGDASRPKWMKEAQPEDEGRRPEPKTFKANKSDIEIRGRQQEKGISGENNKNQKEQKDITDEAMMLEAGDLRPSSRKPHRAQEDPVSRELSANTSRGQSSAIPDPRAERPLRETKLQQDAPSLQNVGSKGRLNRQALDEQSSQAYISPARRKKPVLKAAESEPDMLFSDSQAIRQASQALPPTLTTQSQNSFRGITTAPISKPSTPIPTRPKVPPRRIPPTSLSALSSSANHRSKGTEAFKRGDYSAAHAAYTSALSALPDTHPITIIILCNRALTSLKVGEPKAAVNDADTALSIIGVSRGEGEKIILGTGEPEKDMREFFGKGLMRKAEALEQMEKWEAATKVWKEAVEAGVGGATSIQGRNRCDKASNRSVGQAQPSAARKPPPLKKVTPEKSSALDDLSGTSSVISAPSTEAVAKLRAANAAAEKADDEKFALADTVDAKLTAWKAGKQDNLRALLGSLDTVLWPEAGWKKIGMHELVIANKVKVIYMKGIAKVHPDKLPLTATTEQKMISGAVFSILNEAWDKFKKENGL
ncbi:MAG: hypothetical protein M1827_000122 [Pycnora praestabilis]|nr:MAG: hypothetical protein M1827_000122 [Pycnora praestabilis]